MTALPHDALPFVSVIIPMFNEEHRIEACVEGLLRQSYRGPLEVLVIDGGSTDRSCEITLAMAARDARVRLLDNPRRRPAAAANIGVAAARGEILCFLSAHGEPLPSYVEESVDVLLRSGAAGVGGSYDHVGTDPRSRAIGLAMSSRYGMASTHRIAQHEQEVDTISHPTFWRGAILEAGGYDEGLTSNEDYELNHRVRTTVGPLVFSPSIRSVYRPRPSLRALARQFHTYGLGKAEVAVRHPDSVRWRHLVPPALVAFVAAAPIVGRTPTGRRAIVLAALGYLGLLGVAVRAERPSRHDASTRTFVMALPTMHLSWGTGVLRGLVRRVRR
jgi:succinoglycan biosynthesis protein ExoA